MNINLQKRFYSRKLDQLNLYDLIKILNKNLNENQDKIKLQKILDQVIITYNFNKHRSNLRSKKSKQVVNQVKTASVLKYLNTFDENFRLTTCEGAEGTGLKVGV